ncbi:UNVERIFIED_CONTAM: hypothetical protein FKN15_011065 [Acipenser sinensis]
MALCVRGLLASDRKQSHGEYQRSESLCCCSLNGFQTLRLFISASSPAFLISSSYLGRDELASPDGDELASLGSADFATLGSAGHSRSGPSEGDCRCGPSGGDSSSGGDSGVGSPSGSGDSGVGSSPLNSGDGSGSSPSNSLGGSPSFSPGSPLLGAGCSGSCARFRAAAALTLTAGTSGFGTGNFGSGKNNSPSVSGRSSRCW